MNPNPARHKPQKGTCKNSTNIHKIENIDGAQVPLKIFYKSLDLHVTLFVLYALF